MACLGVLFLACLVHAIIGFGSALVAMPLLTLLVGVPTAAPLVALVMLTTIVVLLVPTHESVDVRAAWQLLLASAAGIPVGLLLLRSAPESLVKAVLGVVLVGFGAYNLMRPRLPKLHREGWVAVFGFAAGVLGGAYNTNGPPVVLYGALRQWPPDRFRATLQGYFLPAAILICTGHALGGLWNASVFRLYALSLPVVLVAVFVGVRLGRRIPAERFGRTLHAALVVLGILMFV